MAPIPKKYFHDRLVLLLLSISTFLTVLSSILIFLRLSGGRNDGYIVQYRANLGISAFKSGSSSELLAFIGFAVIVLVVHTVLSIRMYDEHRQYSVIILGMGVFLLALCMIVSNALLVLR